MQCCLYPYHLLEPVAVLMPVLRFGASEGGNASSACMIRDVSSFVQASVRAVGVPLAGGLGSPARASRSRAPRSCGASAGAAVKFSPSGPQGQNVVPTLFFCTGLLHARVFSGTLPHQPLDHPALEFPHRMRSADGAEAMVTVCTLSSK